MTVGYLALVHLLGLGLSSSLGRSVDVASMKDALKPSVVIYNVFQVLVNGYIVFDIIAGLAVRGHPFVGDVEATDCW